MSAPAAAPGAEAKAGGSASGPAKASDPKAASAKPADKKPGDRLACVSTMVAPTLVFRPADLDDGTSKKNKKSRPAAGLFVVWAPVLPKEAKPPEANKARHESAADVGTLTLGFVDGHGYLQNVTPGKNPWASISAQLAAKDGGNKTAASAESHSQRFCEGQAYRLWLIAHPYVGIAQAAVQYLLTNQADKKHDFTALKSLDVTPARVKDGKKSSFPVNLPTSVDSYWPGGSPHYDGWLLYRDMPYGVLPAVRTAVKKLAGDLGSLRYPTSSDGQAYAPTHDGWFREAMMACVHAFQRHSKAGRAFLVDGGSALTGPAPSIASPSSESFAFLLGRQVTLSAAPPPAAAAAAATTGAGGAGPAAPPAPSTAPAAAAAPKPTSVAHGLASAEFVPAAADKATADAIAEWKQKGFRKPGDILIATGPGKWKIWMQPRLAFAISAWNALGRALGCPYDLHLSNSFRVLNPSPGAGQTSTSYHALGLAIDLSSKFDEDYSDETSRRKPEFPVVFEALWEEDKALQRARAAATKAAAAVDAATKERDAFAKAVDAGNVSDAPKARQAKWAKLLKDDKASAAELKRLTAAAASQQQAKEAADQKVEALLADEWKLSYRLHFRLYGHSTLDALGLKAADLSAKITAAMAVEAKASLVATKDAQSSEVRSSAGDPELDAEASGDGGDGDGDDDGSDGDDDDAGAAASAAGASASTGGGTADKAAAPSASSGLVDSYERSLRALFGPVSPAQLPVVDGWVKPAVEVMRKAVAKLVQLANEPGSKRDVDYVDGKSRLAYQFYRPTVRPFENDAWSKDGGDSLDPVSAADDAADPDVAIPKLAATAKCWLNLSRIAHLVDLGHISARNKDFKRTYQHPGVGKKDAGKMYHHMIISGTDTLPPPRKKGATPPDPEKLDPYKDPTKRGALRRLALAIERMKSDDIEMDVIVTLPEKKGEAKVARDDFDTALMRNWPPVAWEKEMPPGFELAGLDLAISISADPETAKKQGEALTPIFQGKSFFVLEIGPDLQTGIKPGPAGKIKDFVNSLGQTKTKPSDKSSRKARTGWIVTLRPYLVGAPGADAAKPSPAPIDLWKAAITLPGAGSPKGLEWWHYEHRSRAAKDWIELIDDMGYSREVITAPVVPNDSPGGFAVRGAGFKAGGRYPFPDEPNNVPSDPPEGG